MSGPKKDVFDSRIVELISIAACYAVHKLAPGLKKGKKSSPGPLKNSAFVFIKAGLPLAFFSAPLVFRIAILSSMLLDVCVCARARFEQALGMYPSVTERFYQRFSETTASVAPYARRRNRN